MSIVPNNSWEKTGIVYGNGRTDNLSLGVANDATN